MDTPFDFQHSIQITRDELLYLMDLSGGKILLGVNRKELEEGLDRIRQAPDPLRASLEKKGILQKKNTASSTAQPLLETLFFPERGMIVFRERPNVGRQIFYLMQKAGRIVLHSFPQEQEHFLALIPRPEDLLTLLIGCFPFIGLPYSPAKFHFNGQTFEQLFRLAKFGKKSEIEALFGSGNTDPEQSKNFIRSMMERKISGSISTLSVQAEQAEEMDSVMLHSDGRTAWMVFRDEASSPENPFFTARQTGPDIAMTIRRLAEQLTNQRFPRKQVESSGKWIRFALSLDELVLSLKAINCSDLANKMYAAASSDSAGRFFSERMAKAQQSLVESELCTVSARGLPILDDDLAQAVLPIAKSDSAIQLSGVMNGSALDMYAYLVRGRYFSVYRNQGEYLQLLDYGKYKDVVLLIESIFPDFGSEKKILKKDFPIAYEILEKALKMADQQQEAMKILISGGIVDSDAELLMEDISGISLRALLSRSDPPDSKKKPEEKKGVNRPSTLLLLQSPKRSWMFKFDEITTKGKASITDRKDFRKALDNLIA